MSGTSLQEYARAFDGRAAELMDGVDASESYFTFFEKAMKLQASFAADLEALCSSRHAHTARLFNSTPAEHNPELAAAWSETVDALRTIAQAHKQCSKVMHDQVCRPILQMRTTLEPQLKSSLSLGRKVIQECRTSHSKVKQEEKKFHRAAAAAATETDDLKKQRLEQDQTGREMVYRDALASHEQRTRQATTVALPGLYNELAQMEWRRIRTVATATTTALQAMQASARVLCDDAEDNRVNRAVSRMKEISEDCVHVDVDVQVEPAPSFEPVTQEMIEEQRPRAKSGRGDVAAGFFRNLFGKLASTPQAETQEGGEDSSKPQVDADTHAAESATHTDATTQDPEVPDPAQQPTQAATQQQPAQSETPTVEAKAEDAGNEDGAEQREPEQHSDVEDQGGDDGEDTRATADDSGDADTAASTDGAEPTTVTAEQEDQQHSTSSTPDKETADTSESESNEKGGEGDDEEETF